MPNSSSSIWLPSNKLPYLLSWCSLETQVWVDDKYESRLCFEPIGQLVELLNAQHHSIVRHRYLIATEGQKRDHMANIQLLLPFI